MLSEKINHQDVLLSKKSDAQNEENVTKNHKLDTYKINIFFCDVLMINDI